MDSPSDRSGSPLKSAFVPVGSPPWNSTEKEQPLGSTGSWNGRLIVASAKVATSGPSQIVETRRFAMLARNLAMLMSRSSRRNDPRSTAPRLRWARAARNRASPRPPLMVSRPENKLGRTANGQPLGSRPNHHRYHNYGCGPNWPHVPVSPRDTGNIPDRVAIEVSSAAASPSLSGSGG